MNKAQRAAHNERQQEARDGLIAVIQEFVAAEIADSWKGGGDPADEPLIEAELLVAKYKLDRHIEKLFPLEPE